MNKEYTHITFLLDRSGSMNKVKNDTIGGFNTFVNDQKKVETPATMSLYQFDDRFEPNYLFKPVSEVQELNEDTYKPRGWTCLLDAIGRAVVETGEGLNKLEEAHKPSKVVFVVQTDGEENRSKEFTYDDISKLVKQQTDKFNWEFVFLGAKLEAVKQAQGWGIKCANTMQYAESGVGTRSAIMSMSKNLASYRGGAKADMSFEKADIEEQEKLGAGADTKSSKPSKRSMKITPPYKRGGMKNYLRTNTGITGVPVVPGLEPTGLEKAKAKVTGKKVSWVKKMFKSAK